MEERIEIDSKNPDDVIGKVRTVHCIYCSKMAYSMTFTNPELKTPEGWHHITQNIAPGIDQRVGYLCPDCWKEVNKPFSYSITVNGKRVQPPKTITLFEDKGGESNDRG